MVLKCTKPITINDEISSVMRRLGVGLRYALWRKGP
jgi:hypothetical protein